MPGWDTRLTFDFRMSIKNTIKGLLRKLPIGFTKNQRYDQLTRKIMKQYLQTDSNCVDVGAHRGEILDLIIYYAPAGEHFAFEPVPELFRELEHRYQCYKNCHLFPVALSNQNGSSSFNHVVSNPAYSGLKKRQYDRKNETDQTILVKTDRMDNIIPEETPIHLIKIDVEGGELDVLKGAVRILMEHKPLVVFECGLGGSDFYGTTPQMMFDFFKNLGYKISLLDRFLRKKPSLSRDEFVLQFELNRNYYFIAHRQYP